MQNCRHVCRFIGSRWLRAINKERSCLPEQVYHVKKRLRKRKGRGKNGEKVKYLALISPASTFVLMTSTLQSSLYSLGVLAPRQRYQRPICRASYLQLWPKILRRSSAKAAIISHRLEPGGKVFPLLFIVFIGIIPLASIDVISSKEYNCYCTNWPPKKGEIRENPVITIHNKIKSNITEIFLKKSRAKIVLKLFPKRNFRIIFTDFHYFHWFFARLKNI